MQVALPTVARRHWAVNASIAIHAAVIVGLLLFRAEPKAPRPVATMPPRIDIDLSAPLVDEPRDEAVPAEQSVAAVAPLSSAPPPVEEIAADTLPEPPALEPSPPEPPPELALEPDPAPVEPVVTSAAADAAPVPPKPPPRSSPPKPPRHRPKPVEPPKTATARPEQAPPPPTVQEPTPAAAAPASSAARATAPAPDAAPAGPPPDYLALLRARLQRAMEYPRSARMQGIQGQATLWLLIDREGRVLQHRVVRSSGYEVLDREADAVARKASPLPPIPAAMGQGELAIQVPVSFSLR
jgi:protein TonB